MNPTTYTPPVLLDHLFDALDVRAVLDGRDGVEIADLAYDSRRVAPGALFVCVPGALVDGHEHAAAAVAAGAVALVCERPLDVAVPQVVVPDARSAMAPLADRFFGEPTRTLRVAGVTGTNGKTTTAYVTRAILEAAGVRCGLLGTIEQVVGGAAEPVERTTPEAIDLQRTFRRMLDAGDRACAMEVSSHALDLHRVDGVRFAAAAFTNLSQDHLDFHGTMEEYFAAKARLFDGRCPTATNAADPYGTPARRDHPVRRARRPTSAPTTLRLEPGGSRVPARHARRRRSPVQTRLRGAFNVANVLAAASLAHLMEVPLAGHRRRHRRAGRRARPAGAGRGGPAVPGAGRLRAHARRARPPCCRRRAASRAAA